MSTKPHAVARAIRTALVVSFCILMLGHIGTVIVSHQANLQHGSWQVFTQQFDLDNENNVPEFYTSLILGFSALFALILAVQASQRKHKTIWAFFSAGMLYLAFDEALVIHEQIAAPIRSHLDISNNSFWYHAWVLPALALAALAVLALLYVRRHKLIHASQMHVIKLLVALVMIDALLESIGTHLYANPVVYKLGPVMVEELFEIGMISWICYSLASYAGFDSSKQLT